jgi:hypothetical protein
VQRHRDGKYHGVLGNYYCNFEGAIIWKKHVRLEPYKQNIKGFACHAKKSLDWYSFKIILQQPGVRMENCYFLEMNSVGSTNIFQQVLVNCVM